MNKMFNFNGMPRKRSGHAGGKGVSMIGMLVLLMAALLVLPSCFDDDDDDDAATTTPIQCGAGTMLNDAGDACVAEPVDQVTCGAGTVPNTAGDECIADPAEEYDMVGELEGECYMDGDRDGMIAGTDAAECIDGEGGNDSIKGMGGDDELRGGPGNDTLDGGAGNDTLDGGAGNDTLMGEAGDDELKGGTGDNTLDGGDGTDIAVYLDDDIEQVKVTLRGDADGAAIVVPKGQSSEDPFGDGATRGMDILRSIENVKGTHGADIINGDGNANLLKGLDGDDMINGHGGDDTIIPNRPMPPADGETDAVDGKDVVDGGEGANTISYEGENSDTAVEIDLSAIVLASVDDDGTTDGNQPGYARVRAAVGTQAGEAQDVIKTVTIGTGDDAKTYSSFVNIKGGAGGDTLTGDDRDNILNGGPGNDTLMGGPGNDTLMGGPGTDTSLDGGAGDDTYMGVEADETVTEAEDGGMDTVYYASLDDPTTEAEDESMNGVTVTATNINNVEMVFGTQNVDNMTAAAGATILGLGGNDMLTADANNTAGENGNTLVGCAGENTLTGSAGNDVFGVYNDGANADTIVNFTTGADMATTDEIHLKGFGSGTAEPRLIPGNSIQAGVYVGNVLVAKVGGTSDTDFVVDAEPDADPPVAAKTQAEGILDALKKSNAEGMKVVRIVDFTPDKCM